MNASKKTEVNSFLDSPLNKLSKPYRVQSAAVLSTKDTPIDQMFVISKKLEINWGIEGYEAAKKYLDPSEQVKQRAYSAQKKGQKNKNYVTKRGSYLADLKVISDQVPPPNKYDIAFKWKEANPKLTKPLSAPMHRLTFIDEIKNEAKKRPIPGAGKYDLEKPLKQKLEDIEKQSKIKIPASERPSYLNEYQFMSDVNPGPGTYNPRIQKQVREPLHMNDTKPKDQIEKHKKQDKSRIKSAYPDMGTYKHHPVEYDTFGKLLFKNSDKKGMQNEIKRNYFGNDKRFKDLTQSKSKQNVQVPGPGQYPLQPQWPGKEEGKTKSMSKVKHWMQSISKGVVKSIYY